MYFDVPPPAQSHGIQVYRDSWAPFFAYIGESGRFDLDDLHVVAGNDVAFAHAILLVQGENELSPARVRLTVGLHKVRGEWLVVHEHHSAPYEASTGTRRVGDERAGVTHPLAEFAC